jgi:hypothetical protein
MASEKCAQQALEQMSRAGPAPLSKVPAPILGTELEAVRAVEQVSVSLVGVISEDNAGVNARNTNEGGPLQRLNSVAREKASPYDDPNLIAFYADEDK